MVSSSAYMAGCAIELSPNPITTTFFKIGPPTYIENGLDNGKSYTAFNPYFKKALTRSSPALDRRRKDPKTGWE